MTTTESYQTGSFVHIPFEELAHELTGSLLTPDQPAYAETVSPWNLAVPARLREDRPRQPARTLP